MAGRQKKTVSDTGWGIWAAIVVLFALGIWPIALILLLVKLFGKDSKQTRQVPPPLSEQRTGSGAAAQSRSMGRGRTAVRTAMQSPLPKKSNAKWLKIAGIVLLAVGVLGMGGPIDALFWSDYWFSLWLPELLQFLALAAAGGAMLGAGIGMDRSLKRYAKYLVVVGDREAMPVAELARTLGYSAGRVEKDLEKMVDKGYFGDTAFLNVELGYLLRSGQADAELKRKRQEAQSAQTPKEAEEGYSGILRNIRRANDAIADPFLSAKIDRLEEITARIFRAVEEDPRKRAGSTPSSTTTCPPPRSCWTLTRSSKPPGWRGRTSARLRPASRLPWTPLSGASSTSWTSCTRPTPWTWTATSGSWRPC